MEICKFFQLRISPLLISSAFTVRCLALIYCWNFKACYFLWMIKYQEQKNDHCTPTKFNRIWYALNCFHKQCQQHLMIFLFNADKKTSVTVFYYITTNFSAICWKLQLTKFYLKDRMRYKAAASFFTWGRRLSCIYLRRGENNKFYVNASTAYFK